ncbi:MULTISPECIES: carbohydrate porin [Vibrio]|uniref:Carbohydrate porin n=2 Tax=Vibrio TaxID=662 RepID=A0ABV4KL81_9VIBR|nr:MULTISPECIES: carbohydrate porin [Vibrio]MDH5930043.1 carbohydrate porin [Vibrio splendidus]OEF53714.1 maltoporin [Vibrio tasmaniensis 1F-267]
MKKVSLIAAAVASALVAGSAFAESEVALDVTSGDSAMEVEVKNPTDVLSDGWEVHGYMSSNYRLIDGNTDATTFSKGDYHVAGSSATSESTNQVEFVIKKHSEYGNGVWANYNVRTEYGNGNSYAYSSSGNQKNNTDSQFEVKEAFIEIGALPYLGEDSVVWAGQRFLNRSAGILSGEFWKQSSGVGAGFETKLAGNKFGIAAVSADPKATVNDTTKERQTRTSLDFYYYGVDAGIGSLDFDAKLMKQDRVTGSNADEAESGVGLSVTLNSSYYGLDGWAQTGIAYGTGMATNRGVNFGEWNENFLEDDNSLFITSYGVLNISDKVQLGTEFTHWEMLEIGAWGLDEGGSRTMFAARPSYKVNDNLRFELTASYSIEKAEQWHAKDGSWVFVEAAPVFTVNADYFGRPQIKPYVAYMTALEDGVGNKGIDGSKDETVVGVHAEIWF